MVNCIFTMFFVTIFNPIKSRCYAYAPTSTYSSLLSPESTNNFLLRCIFDRCGEGKMLNAA